MLWRVEGCELLHDSSKFFIGVSTDGFYFIKCGYHVIYHGANIPYCAISAVIFQSGFEFIFKSILETILISFLMYTKKDIKNKSKRQSTIIELLNGEVIWELNLLGNSNSNTYKAERKDIYQGI